MYTHCDYMDAVFVTDAVNPIQVNKLVELCSWALQDHLQRKRGSQKRTPSARGISSHDTSSGQDGKPEHL